MREREREREITREVKRALNEMKGGKAPGLDGVRVEMLKGGVTVLEWMVSVFNICIYVVSSTIGLGNSMHGAIIQRQRRCA